MTRPPPKSPPFPYPPLFRSVTSANPQSVSVPAGGTATTSFTVSCAGATIAELAGNGAIGPGTPTTGSEYQTFVFDVKADLTDRKSTRLNSSHLVISYAVFCL